MSERCAEVGTFVSVVALVGSGSPDNSRSIPVRNASTCFQAKEPFLNVNFFILRGLINLEFLVGILLHFVWADVTLIMIGAALFGLARGGGEIMFNLWVTKVAPFDRIADYMSVHTFLAGIRLLLAPFLGFFLVTWVSVSLMVAVSASLALASIGFVSWAARAAREDVDFGRRLG